MTNTKPTRPAAKKQGMPLVFKPYLTGKPVSALLLRRGVRILSYLLVSAVLFFFLGQLLSIEYAWLRMLVNLLVLAAFASLMYSDGVAMGEGDVAFAEIALARQSEGKPVSEEDKARCFHPAKGFLTALTGALPIVLLCLVYAFMARLETYSLGALPSWVAGFENRPDVGPALAYYHNRPGFQIQDLLRLLTRLMVFPYVNLVGADNTTLVLWVERLSPLLVTLVPLAYGFGYLRGPHFRARVHGGIASNRQKAQRKAKKRKAPARQQPKQLV